MSSRKNVDNIALGPYVLVFWRQFQRRSGAEPVLGLLQIRSAQDEVDLIILYVSPEGPSTQM